MLFIHMPFQVGDLGLSKVKCQTLISGGVRGTLPWMAPELLNGSSSMVSDKVCQSHPFKSPFVAFPPMKVLIFGCISGRCVLFWDCDVGTSHRRRTLCRLTLWSHYRYALYSSFPVLRGLFNPFCFFFPRHLPAKNTCVSSKFFVWSRNKLCFNSQITL